MAATKIFFLTICCALLLTAYSLQCYTKVQTECSPSGPLCNTIAPSSANVNLTVTDCDAGATLCAVVKFKGTGNDITISSETAQCLTADDTTGFTSGCYDKEGFEKIDPQVAEGLKQFEELTGITIDTLEACICEENLCNGSIKSVFSISVLITSIIMSFTLFM